MPSQVSTLEDKNKDNLLAEAHDILCTRTAEPGVLYGRSLTVAPARRIADKVPNVEHERLQPVTLLVKVSLDYRN